METYTYPKASVQHRLGGRAVDIAMYSVTLGIGWIIWSLVVWGQGQTPGKQIVKLRVYDKTTGKRVKWGHMAIREFLLPFFFLTVTWVFLFLASRNGTESNHPLFVIFLNVPLFIVWLVDAFWILKDDKRNRLVDIFCKTDILNEAPQN